MHELSGLNIVGFTVYGPQKGTLSELSDNMSKCLYG